MEEPRGAVARTCATEREVERADTQGRRRDIDTTRERAVARPRMVPGAERPRAICTGAWDEPVAADPPPRRTGLPGVVRGAARGAAHGPVPGSCRRGPQSARSPAGGPRAAPDAEPPASRPAQEIRFCTSEDGVRIAWATTGEGSVVVKTANWLNHIELDWDSPVWRPWLAELSRGRRLVRYDARGNGLWDWN